MNVMIRQAHPDDADAIYTMISELSMYECISQASGTSVESIRNALFGQGSTNDAFICEVDEVIAGYAVTSSSYSTWLDRRGLYMEDMYFTPPYRDREAGQAMLHYIAQYAVKHQYSRLEWGALSWNQTAKAFYLSIGALPLDEWVRYRLDGPMLHRFAENSLFRHA